MMDKETNNLQQENPSLLPNNNTTSKELESPRKPFATGFVIGGSSSGGDRLKRDEWSEGAVSSLLEAYESKWVLRNRAKLKGHDWEEVAKHVSSRANGTKSPKTQTQCKNKIESMKKRYRSESATADASSSWPLYSRLDLLLRGNVTPSTVSTPQLLSQAQTQTQTQIQAISAVTSTTTTPTLVQAQAVIPVPISFPSTHSQLLFMEPSPLVATQVVPPPLSGPPALGTAQNSHGSNGVERVTKEGGAGNKLSDHASDKNQLETDSSTPALYSEKEKLRSKRMKMMKIEKRKRKRKEDQLEIAESIRWLAEVVVKSEQARMDTMREIEKMRVEAEAKRDEMDLKRTEIIANTQLEIARLFAACSSAKGTVDSSLRIGRN